MVLRKTKHKQCPLITGLKKKKKKLDKTTLVVFQTPALFHSITALPPNQKALGGEYEMLLEIQCKSSTHTQICLPGADQPCGQAHHCYSGRVFHNEKN